MYVHSTYRQGRDPTKAVYKRLQPTAGSAGTDSEATAVRCRRNSGLSGGASWRPFGGTPVAVAGGPAAPCSGSSCAAADRPLALRHGRALHTLDRARTGSGFRDQGSGFRGDGFRLPAPGFPLPASRSRLPALPAEGEGLEPPRACARRFSRPLPYQLGLALRGHSKVRRAAAGGEAASRQPSAVSRQEGRALTADGYRPSAPRSRLSAPGCRLPAPGSPQPALARSAREVPIEPGQARSRLL